VKRYFLIAILIGMSLDSTDAINQKLVMALESSLDGALKNDRTIELKLGTDFLDRRGTVIFLSRKLGKKRMIELARSGEKELPILFLPHWNAWVTEVNSRKTSETWIFGQYVNAALASENDVEDWHTHNDIGEDWISPEKKLERSLGWTVPSVDDLFRTYNKSIHRHANFKAVIANIYGTTSYWYDGSHYPKSIDVESALEEEAEKLYEEVSKSSIQGLEKTIGKHKGLIKLEFHPYPPAKAR
jgi:hypothetical protein